MLDCLGVGSTNHRSLRWSRVGCRLTSDGWEWTLHSMPWRSRRRAPPSTACSGVICGIEMVYAASGQRVVIVRARLVSGRSHARGSLGNLDVIVHWPHRVVRADAFQVVEGLLEHPAVGLEQRGEKAPAPVREGDPALIAGPPQRADQSQQPTLASSRGVRFTIAQGSLVRRLIRSPGIEAPHTRTLLAWSASAISTARPGAIGFWSSGSNQRRSPRPHSSRAIRGRLASLQKIPSYPLLLINSSASRAGTSAHSSVQGQRHGDNACRLFTMRPSAWPPPPGSPR